MTIPTRYVEDSGSLAQLQALQAAIASDAGTLLFRGPGSQLPWQLAFGQAAMGSGIGGMGNASRVSESPIKPPSETL